MNAPDCPPLARHAPPASLTRSAHIAGRLRMNSMNIRRLCRIAPPRPIAQAQAAVVQRFLPGSLLVELREEVAGMRSMNLALGTGDRGVSFSAPVDPGH